ncbi:MAG: YwaF family protein [Clostridia bacterium]|nr:YwaF family protein [Clostridia bacterium]
MGAFFGKPEYGTPEGAYSWQHLLHVSLLMVLMVVFAVLLGRKNRNKDEKTKNQVLVWTAFLINGFELFRVAFNIGASDDGLSWQKDLPLFLCSIQFIAIPIAAFTKGRVKEAALDFVFIFGILSAVAGNFGASQIYNSRPVLSILPIFSGTTHTLSGFASLYIVISQMQSMKKKNIPITVGILLGFCMLAMIANAAFDYNYMFFVYHDGTPYSIVYDWVNGHPVFYPMLVILLFIVYMAIFYGIYYLCKNRTKKSKATK